MTKLSDCLRDVDLVDRWLVNVEDGSIVTDDLVEHKVHTFESLARAFVGSPLTRQTLNRSIPASSADAKSTSHVCSCKVSEREPCKGNRCVTVCLQVTQHQIWTATHEEILNGLKYESGLFEWPIPKTRHYDGCLKYEEELFFHLKKFEAMKEGLSQIREVAVDKCIGYKDARHQESLVQRKLTKKLGDSSPCLVSLRLYYLYGYVRDLEVDLSGGIWGHGEDSTCCLHMGRIFRLFRFVWETAAVKEFWNCKAIYGAWELRIGQ
ncbi:hypothetical protein ACJRO7_014469 [Eucalyptus globulus]|uniref:Uncharacterized protein n=1 Tax=Eucalyptus globulus TaxID=34317 RepID=A0ABD3L096_EUCGL